MNTVIVCNVGLDPTDQSLHSSWSSHMILWALGVMNVNLVDTQLQVDALHALIALKDIVQPWEQIPLMHARCVLLRSIFRAQGNWLASAQLKVPMTSWVVCNAHSEDSQTHRSRVTLSASLPALQATQPKPLSKVACFARSALQCCLLMRITPQCMMTMPQ